MTQITLLLEPTVIAFYSHVARQSNLPLEQVLSEILFKLAGELSLSALKSKE